MTTIGIELITCKGRFHLRFSGIRPLRGYPPPLNGKSVWKKEETPNSVIKENFSRQSKTVDVSRRYGIKKLSGVHRRTKALKKLDMSRCQLSQNGFYELIPIILKSEHVILQVDKVRDGNYQTFLSQGNQITPLELKIFSGQLRYLWSNLFLLLWRKKML